MKKSLRPPILAHIHVPKCAGTSFRLLLDDVFPEGHLQLYFEPGTERSLSTNFVFPDSQVAEFVAPDSVRAFSSHHVRRFPQTLSARPVHYVTFLRNPVEQFVSYLSFTRGVYAHIVDRDLLSHLPPNMPEFALRDCARWLMGRNANTFFNFRENYTTNFFARFEAQSKYGYEYADRRYRSVRLSVAKKVLRNFFLIGLSERMDDSWNLLRPKLAALGVPDCTLSMRRDNVSDKGGEDLSWLNDEDEVGRQVLDSMREDMRLYAWARGRFQLQLAEAQHGARLRWWERLQWKQVRGEADVRSFGR